MSAENCVFVGSWASGDRSLFRCDRCGLEDRRGVNLTVLGDAVDICRECSEAIRGQMFNAEQETQTFDDIRFKKTTK